MCTFNIQKLCTLFENLCFLNIQNCVYCLSKKKKLCILIVQNYVHSLKNYVL